MKLIILGLKEKKTGNYFVYDTEQCKNHTPLSLGETKVISCLDPFPFSNFSSLDKIDERKFEKCYLEVEGALTDNEFAGMRSSGIMYHRFSNREVTLLNEFEDIFQYSLEMLKKFRKQLGTYDLTTWVLHNEAKTEAEFSAAKSIIKRAVEEKDNKKYPLDISLDRYTIVYMDYFRELSERTYNITFGRYGTCDRDLFKNEHITFSDETFYYVMKNVNLYDYSYVNHPQFTFEFYEEFIKGTELEESLFCDIEPRELYRLKEKGFDLDVLYERFYTLKLKRFNQPLPKYEGDFFKIFDDPDFEPYYKRESPLDYYCCEDCDGYDIYELYSEEELAGVDVVVDERMHYLQELIGQWGDFLSSKSYALFDKVPDELLEKFNFHQFFQALLAKRNEI